MSRVFSRLCSMSLTRRALARIMASIFFLSLIPLVLIALYNYPADDDFNFVLPVAQAWVQTGSLWEVVKAICNKCAYTYATWQGDFVSTALFSITPIIFDIRLYFLSNWFTLALVCLSAGYLIKGVVCVQLRADRDTFWIVYVSVMVLALQFLPAIGWSIYWHNGGIYTVTVCFLALLLGLLIRCAAPMTRARSLLRGVLASFLGFLLGGSFYGPMLGALVLLVLITAAAFLLRQPHRRHSLAALAGFAVSLIISVIAPGNAVRQGLNGDPMNPLSAIVTSVLESFDWAGEWMGPQLWGMLLILLPALWTPLRESHFSFRRPLWVLIALYGLYSAAIVPGVYTHAGYDTERYLNALYLYFLIFMVGGSIYLEGALIRWLERRKAEGGGANLLEAARGLGTRYCALLLAVSVALTAFGGFAFTIMNTSSISAAKSLVTGEAARFRQEMAQRQEYVRVTDSDLVDVEVLSSQPYVFKRDRLPLQGIYGTVRYMRMYFELFDGVADP